MEFVESVDVIFVPNMVLDAFSERMKYVCIKSHKGKPRSQWKEDRRSRLDQARGLVAVALSVEAVSNASRVV